MTYNKRYAPLNNPQVRNTVVKLAAERFGYQAQPSSIETAPP